jgi:hypothetical protein
MFIIFGWDYQKTNSYGPVEQYQNFSHYFLSRYFLTVVIIGFTVQRVTME